MTFPTLAVEFSPGSGPFDTPSWVDITDRVLSAQWTFGRQRDLTDWPPGEALLELRNDDRLFDPDHSAGTYAGQLLPRVPFRIRATHGASTYDLFYGFVEDGWEQTYQPPEGSMCLVRLVDMLAVLQGYELPSVLEVEILSDDPVAYWPLDEQTGSAMRDASGNRLDGTYQSGSTALSRLLANDHVTHRGIGFDGEHRGTVGDARAVVLPSSFSATAVVDVTIDGTNNDYRMIVESGPGEGEIAAQMGVFWSSDNTPRLALWSTGICYHSSLTLEQGIHHVAVSSAPATYIDGVAGTSQQNIASSFPNASDVRVGDSADYDGFTWPLAHVAIWDTELSAERIEAHAEAAVAPLDGKRSDEQIAWILDQIGVPSGMRDLDEGASLMGALDSKGKDALALMREIAATEQGSLFVDHQGGGKLRFESRYTRALGTRSTVTQAEFSDDPSDSDAVRVEPDELILEANGVSSIVNRAEVRWVGGTEVTEDATSVGLYGPQSIPVTTLAQTPAQARGIGEWIVTRYGSPQTRVRGLGVNPGAAHDGFPAVLDLRVSDRVTVRRLPQGVGSAKTDTLHVEGATHRVRGMEWTTAFYVTEADVQDWFILGTSTLGGTDLLGY